jgi:hypothetical protein
MMRDYARRRAACAHTNAVSAPVNRPLVCIGRSLAKKTTASTCGSGRPFWFYRDLPLLGMSTPVDAKFERR